MTMSEYKERFGSITPSLHQTFKAAQRPHGGRQRSRYLWIAAALVGVMTMTYKVTSHIAVHDAKGNGLQTSEACIQ
jgi:hypothetical protein